MLARSRAETWTNTSCPPPLGAINPNSFVVFHHFTVPVGIGLSFLLKSSVSPAGCLQAGNRWIAACSSYAPDSPGLRGQIVPGHIGLTSVRAAILVRHQTLIEAAMALFTGSIFAPRPVPEPMERRPVARDLSLTSVPAKICVASSIRAAPLYPPRSALMLPFTSWPTSLPTSALTPALTCE